jgi:hypothetical protein
MWCGECYTSRPGIDFHIRTLGDEPGQNEKNPKDAAKIEKAWGRKTPKRETISKLEMTITLRYRLSVICVYSGKLRKIDPLPSNPQDNLLLACVHRMNLDAFWSRSQDTVHRNRDKLADKLSLSQLNGLEGPCIHDGPYPDYDHCGYEVAIDMLLTSRRPGRNSKTHLQFNTIRKLQSAYGNQVRSSPQSTKRVMALGD